MEIITKCREPYINKEGIAYGCGQCEYCKKIKATEWAIRGYHELQTTEKSVFITLTYNNENLIKSAKRKMCRTDAKGTLIPEDMQKFWKRLRKKISKYDKKRKIRYLMCGEYGGDSWRPHYHAIIYGLSAEESIKLNIEEIWGKGHVDIDTKSITKNCIMYIIGYVRKKVGNRYGGKDIYENNGRIAPYMRTSQGIGREWADKYKNNWTKTCKVGYKNTDMNVPRYYIKRVHKEEGETIKYSVKTKNTIGEIKEEYRYKIIRNPLGTYTRMITETQLNNKKRNYKDWYDKYNWLKRERVKEIINIHKKVDIDRLKKQCDEYLMFKKMTKAEKIRYLSQFKQEKEPRQGQPILNKSYLNEKELKLAHEKAKATCDYIKNGVFGKRDKIEKTEYFQKRA